MKKYKIKGIKTAILIYEDPKYGPRRVAFGEPEALMDLLRVNGDLIFRRIMKLKRKEKDIKSPADLKKAISKTREWFSKNHGEAAGDEDMEMELNYKIKGEK